MKPRARLPVVASGAPGLSLVSGRWVPAILGATLPTEQTATCSTCVMLPPEGEAYTHDSSYFDPNVRCCSYSPRLASFQVGGALIDRSRALAEGRRRLEARIAARTGLTPMGLVPTPHEAWMVESAERAFGKHGALRCPYYDGDAARCTVWQFRPAVCVTWFCKHDRGNLGSRLWSAAAALISVIERSVATHCAVTLDIGTDALAEMVIAPPADPAPGPAAMDATQDGSQARAMWGKWFGREREFYEACARIALDLDAAAVERIGGAELAAAAAAVKGLQRRLGDGALPERLKTSRFEIVSMNDQWTRLQSYSPYDPVDVPTELVTVLGAFDGRPTAAVCEQLRTRGIQLPPAILRQLVDFDILAPAD